MRRYLRDSIVFALVLTTVILFASFFVGMTAVDIQLHDTYFIFDTASWIFLIVGTATFLFFLTLGISRKFSTLTSIVGLIAGLVFMFFILLKILQMLLAIHGGLSVWVISALMIIVVTCIILLTRKVHRQWKKKAA